MIYIALILGIIFLIFYTAEIIYVGQGISNNKDNNDIDQRDGVTVIKPIKDLDFELEKNLDSWLQQDYKGPVQYIFSFQDDDDPAINVVNKLKNKYPEKDITIISNPIIDGLNGKSSNMQHGLKIAKYDQLIFGDSDTRVMPNYISSMITLLKKKRVGVVCSAQVNVGGHDFWTRFFTFIQNCETVFHWTFLTQIGMKIGGNGAGFAIKKDVLSEIGGIESFGTSLLEDTLMGYNLIERGYKVQIGPYIECRVNKLPKEKALNYMRRDAIGLRSIEKSNIPVFVFMLFWYWLLLIIGCVTMNIQLVSLCLWFIVMRIVIGLLQRVVTEKRIMLIDFVLPIFFDLFGTFYLIYCLRSSRVVWRGIEYEIQDDGNIKIL